MAEPIVHLELQPGAGQQVEGGGRDEGVSGQELTAHAARVGLGDRRLGFRVGQLDRDVPSESTSDAPHQRALLVVVGPVCRPSRQVVDRRVRDPGSARRQVCGAARVVQIPLAQPGAKTDQGEDAQRLRETGPPEPPVGPLGESGEHSGEKPSFHRFSSPTPCMSRRDGVALITES